MGTKTYESVMGGASIDEVLATIKGLIGSRIITKKALVDWNDNDSTGAVNIEIDLDEVKDLATFEKMISPNASKASGMKFFTKGELKNKGKRMFSHDGPLGERVVGYIPQDAIPATYIKAEGIYPYINDVFETLTGYPSFSGSIPELMEFARLQGFDGVAIVHEANHNLKFMKEVFSHLCPGCDHEEVDFPEGGSGAILKVPSEGAKLAGEIIEAYNGMFDSKVTLSDNKEAEDSIPVKTVDPTETEKVNEVGFEGYTNVSEIQGLVDTLTEELGVAKVPVIRLDTEGYIELDIKGSTIEVHYDDDAYVTIYQGNILDTNGNLTTLLKNTLATSRDFASRIQRIGRFKRKKKTPSQLRRHKKDLILNLKKRVKEEKDPVKRKIYRHELAIKELRFKNQMSDVEVTADMIKESGMTTSGVLVELTKSLSTKVINIDDTSIKGKVIYMLEGSTKNISHEDMRLVKGLANESNGYLPSISSMDLEGSETYKLYFITNTEEFEEADETLSSSRVQKRLFSETIDLRGMVDGLAQKVPSLDKSGVKKTLERNLELDGDDMKLTIPHEWLSQDHYLDYIADYVTELPFFKGITKSSNGDMVVTFDGFEEMKSVKKMFTHNDSIYTLAAREKVSFKPLASIDPSKAIKMSAILGRDESKIYKYFSKDWNEFDNYACYVAKSKGTKLFCKAGTDSYLVEEGGMHYHIICGSEGVTVVAADCCLPPSSINGAARLNETMEKSLETSSVDTGTFIKWHDNAKTPLKDIDKVYAIFKGNGIDDSSHPEVDKAYDSLTDTDRERVTKIVMAASGHMKDLLGSDILGDTYADSPNKRVTMTYSDENGVKTLYSRSGIPSESELNEFTYGGDELDLYDGGFTVTRDSRDSSIDDQYGLEDDLAAWMRSNYPKLDFEITGEHGSGSTVLGRVDYRSSRSGKKTFSLSDLGGTHDISQLPKKDLYKVQSILDKYLIYYKPIEDETAYVIDQSNVDRSDISDSKAAEVLKLMKKTFSTAPEIVLPKVPRPKTKKGYCGVAGLGEKKMYSSIISPSDFGSWTLDQARTAFQIAKRGGVNGGHLIVELDSMESVLADMTGNSNGVWDSVRKKLNFSADDHLTEELQNKTVQDMLDSMDVKMKSLDETSKEYRTLKMHYGSLKYLAKTFSSKESEDGIKAQVDAIYAELDSYVEMASKQRSKLPFDKQLPISKTILEAQKEAYKKVNDLMGR